MATFVRVYESEEQAAGAAQNLKAAGFAAGSVLTVMPEDANAAAAAAAAGMAEIGPFVAEQAALGRAVVAVQPPFGQGMAATQILDAAGPLPVEKPAPKTKATSGVDAKSSATPLSNMFGWSVLSDSATPLSDMFGWKVKSDKAAPLSDWLGWSTLSDKTYYMVSELKDEPAPLSSWLGWRVLSKTAAPLSDRFGWPTKSAQTHYLTDKLVKDPTPLSSRLGMSVLTEKQ
jgi:hypothetical protein